MTKKLHRSLEELKKSTQPKRFSGLLGITIDGKRTVEVPNRKGYVYVRLGDNQSELVQAINVKLSPIYDLPVQIQRVGSRWEVVGRDTGRYDNWGTTTAFLPKHGKQHSYDREHGHGADPVWVYPDQFTPLLVYPSGTDGAGGLQVSKYVLQRTSDFAYVGGTGTPSLLGYRPTDANTIVGLLYLDKTTGNPGYLIASGTPLAFAITGTAGILPYLPYPNSNQEPLYGFTLVSGTTSLIWDNLYNVRQFIGGNSPTATGTITPAMLSVASAQYKYLVAGATPFAYAESVGALNIASGKTLTVSNSLTIAGTDGGAVSLAITSGKTLTLTATDNWNLTVPGTGVALVKATALSVGHIPFGIANNLVGEDAGLFWDNTNKRLGIGTVTPGGALEIYGGDLHINKASGTSIIRFQQAGDSKWGILQNYASIDGISFYSYKATSPGSKLEITKEGKLGIGVTAPQGMVHGKSGIGSFMHWDYDGVAGTPITVIANGAGDVVYGVSFSYAVRSSDGAFNAGSSSVANGGSITLAVGFTLSVAADGSVTVVRSSGTLTYKVTLWLNWM